MNKLKTILVGVDFSECSRCALEQAVRLARWNNAGLRIVHAISPTSVNANDQRLQHTLDELRGQIRKHAIARLARTPGELPTRKPDVQTAPTHELVVRALAEAPLALHLARLLVDQGVAKENEHVLQWIGERAARRTLLAAGRQLVALHRLAEPADVLEMSQASLLGSLREVHL